MTNADITEDPLSCPVPFGRYDRVVLAHGGGGRLMQRLIRDLFVARFGGEALARAHDGATFDAAGTLATTVDAFTVQPLFFPGGDIGSLAVHGTVNDLAMCGARPRYLTASFILEEGLPLGTLDRVVRSMAASAREAGVQVLAGDTKVVERGKGDGIFITTTGIGEVITPNPVTPGRVRAGDTILVSGPLGDHGVAVMLEREGVTTSSPVESDAASVWGAVEALVDAGVDIHCLRDPTRGGLAAALNEVAMTANVGVHLDERAVPIREAVADACELLGLDPLYVACEGRFVAFVPEADTERALSALHDHPAAPSPARIGTVTDTRAGSVTAVGPLGGERVLDLLSGEQLPRIC